MKNILEQCKEKAQQVRLREDERVAMRTFLENLTEAHPVRETTHDRLQKAKKVLSSYQFLPLFMRRTTMPVVLIMLLVGGSVSFAAQGSLPGDALYGVKVNFNERVEGALSMSGEAKANLEAHLAERRLIEAEKLASKGELNSEIESEIESRFTAHATRVEERIEALSKSEVLVALDVASRFEASLNAHEGVLARASGTESLNMAVMMNEDALPQTMQMKSFVATDAREEVSANVSESVRVQAEKITNIRANLEARISQNASTQNKTSAEGKMKAAQKKILEVRAFIDSKTEANSEARARADAELKLAENAYAEGKISFEAEDYNEAFILFQKSLRLAQEAKVRGTLRHNLEAATDLILVDPMPTSDDVRVNVEGDASIHSNQTEINGGAKVKGNLINIGL